MTLIPSLFDQFKRERDKAIPAAQQLPPNLENSSLVSNYRNIQNAAKTLQDMTKTISSTVSDGRIPDADQKRRFTQSIKALEDEINKQPTNYVNAYQKMIHDNYIKGQNSILRACLLQYYSVLENPTDANNDPSQFQNLGVSYFSPQNQQEDPNVEAINVLMDEINVSLAHLNLMIIEQGTVLDRIEAQLTTACSDMRQGNDTLEDLGIKTKMTFADEIKLHRGFYCFILLMLIIIIFCGSVIIMKKAIRASQRAE